MIKVSIVIPVYNAYKFFSLCLDSIVGQTYKNIEIILVDDKSSDQSLELINDYIKKYNNIKLIALTKNMGVSHARNTGIKESDGDYIFFIDSDDFLEGDAIEKMVAVALKYQADVVDTERLFWYKRKDKILNFMEQKKLKNDLVIGNINNNPLAITMPRYVTGKLYKRSVISNITFDEKLRCYEDALFNHEIKNNFKNYVYASGVFYHYLQRPLSLINTISTNHMDYIYSGTKIKESYEKNKYYNLPIERMINNIIVDDVIVILSFKVPKMNLPIQDKKKFVKSFITFINDLSIKKISLGRKFILGLFKNNVFLSIYFGITKSINLVDLSFRFLNFFHKYKVKDKGLIEKVKLIYKKIS